MISFNGESGMEWSFDENSPIGDPSGMGVVFRGRHTASGKQVAVKRVRLKQGSHAEIRRRDREIEIGLRLIKAAGLAAEKDHLLLPLDHAYSGDDLYIVMPLA